MADRAGGLSFSQALDKALQQATWAGSVMRTPCGSEGGMTSSGSAEPLLDEKMRKRKGEVMAALRWDPDTPVDEALCPDGQYHLLAPSFFRTLAELTRIGRLFTVVIRTFGDDMAEVAAALNSFAAGRHPRASCRHVGCESLQLLPSRVWVGRYMGGNGDSDSCAVGSGGRRGVFSLRRAARGECDRLGRREQEEQEEVLEDEEAVLAALELREHTRGVVACSDHYTWWRDHLHHPSAGKPLWVTEEGGGTPHLL